MVLNNDIQFNLTLLPSETRFIDLSDSRTQDSNGVAVAQYAPYLNYVCLNTGGENVNITLNNFGGRLVPAGVIDEGSDFTVSTVQITNLSAANNAVITLQFNSRPTVLSTIRRAYGAGGQ